jgi:hypothetical protein
LIQGEAAVEWAGTIPCHLPLYSPDLNPREIRRSLEARNAEPLLEVIWPGAAKGWMAQETASGAFGISFPV